MATWELEWKAYGPNHGRSEYYGEHEWRLACAEAGISPEGSYPTEEGANAARDAVSAALVDDPHLISIRVVGPLATA